MNEQTNFTLTVNFANVPPIGSEQTLLADDERQALDSARSLIHDAQLADTPEQSEKLERAGLDLDAELHRRIRRRRERERAKNRRIVASQARILPNLLVARQHCRTPRTNRRRPSARTSRAEAGGGGGGGGGGGDGGDPPPQPSSSPRSLAAEERYTARRAEIRTRAVAEAQSELERRGSSQIVDPRLRSLIARMYFKGIFAPAHDEPLQPSRSEQLICNAIGLDYSGGRR